MSLRFLCINIRCHFIAPCLIHIYVLECGEYAPKFNFIERLSCMCLSESWFFFFICIHRNIFAKDESHFHESDENSCSTENNIPNSNWTIRICVFVRQRAISRNLIDSLQIYLNANINLRVGFGFGFEPKIHWVKCLVRLETVKWWQPAILSKITSISHSQSLDCCWLCCCLITKSFCTLAVPFCPKNFLEQ